MLTRFIVYAVLSLMATLFLITSVIFAMYIVAVFWEAIIL